MESTSPPHLYVRAELGGLVASATGSEIPPTPPLSGSPTGFVEGGSIFAPEHIRYRRPLAQHAINLYANNWGPGRVAATKNAEDAATEELERLCIGAFGTVPGTVLGRPIGHAPVEPAIHDREGEDLIWCTPEEFCFEDDVDVDVDDNTFFLPVPHVVPPEAPPVVPENIALGADILNNFLR